MSNPNQRTFFDFTIGNQTAGRVVFELFNHVVPKTTENFRQLCTGEKGSSPLSGLALHYKMSPVHRVIDGFMIQGGDFTKRNGTGGESVYGKTFADERLEGEGSAVDREGLLVMANRGPNTNSSQFFITLAPAKHLTGKHVVFGKVIHGMPIIHQIGKLSTDSKDRPLSPVVISHCGELELRRPAVPPASEVESRTKAEDRGATRRASGRSVSPSSDSDSDSGRSRSRSRSRSKSRSRVASRSPRRRRYTSSISGASSDSDSDSNSDSDNSRHGRSHKRKHDRKIKDKRRKSEKKSREGGFVSPPSHSRRKRSSSILSSSPKKTEGGTVVETEAELDARLEREEKERLAVEAAERRAKWDEQQRLAKENGGVAYKGRGAMRYRDPETFSSNQPLPANFSQRGGYGNGNGRGGRGFGHGPGQGGRGGYGGRRDDRQAQGRGQGVDADRWAQGVDARPHFDPQRGSQREGRERDERVNGGRDGLERYKTKGEDKRRGLGYDQDNIRGEGGGGGGERETRKREWNDRFTTTSTSAGADTRTRSLSLDRRSASPPLGQGRGGLSLRDRIGPRSGDVPARECSRSHSRSRSPIAIRPDSPLRGDRSGSDMDMDD